MTTALLVACLLSPADVAWVTSLWSAWKALGSELPVADSRLPTLVTFDASCQWEFEGERLVPSRPHEGMVRLPNGEEMPPVLTSFAGTTGEQPFVVISAPAIWRAQPNLQNEPHLDLLIRSVFIHEMTHVLHTPAMAPLLDRLSNRLERPEELNDDIIQDRFGDDEAFRAAYERERDLLYAAVAERDPARRVEGVRAALDAIQRRRDRFFTGERAFYRELEDAFVLMEGAANWAA